MKSTPPIKTKSDQQAIEQGCYFDEQEPKQFREWVETNCVISSGDLAGTLPKMLEWQYQDIIKPLLGWKLKIDGREKLRFREVGIWTPKKQAKSWLMSALALWFQRRELGAQVIVIASDVKQAGIVFNEAGNMLALGPLAPLCGKNDTYWIRHHNKVIQYTADNGFKGEIHVLSSTPEGKSGFHFNLAICDEIAEWNLSHAQMIWDRLKNAGASRRGVMVCISTPQFNLRHIGKDRYNYAKSVLSGERIDTTFLPVIYEIPEDAVCCCGKGCGEGWRCAEWWWRSNPSAGITVSKQDYYDDYSSVENNPREEMRWRTLRCGQWVGSSTQWIASSLWSACKESFNEQWLKENCKLIACGIDVAYRGDLTAYTLLFRHPETKFIYILPRFFSPQQLAAQKTKIDKIDYLRYAREGNLILTEGDCIDPSAVIESLKNDRDIFGDFPIRYDEWGFELMRQALESETFEVIPVSGQTGIIAPPTAYFERLILDKRLRHPGNPVLDYCLGNCVPNMDNYERITVSKKGSRNRIDGIIASIIATTALIAEETEDEWVGPMVSV